MVELKSNKILIYGHFGGPVGIGYIEGPGDTKGPEGTRDTGGPRQSEGTGYWDGVLLLHHAPNSYKGNFWF